MKKKILIFITAIMSLFLFSCSGSKQKLTKDNFNEYVSIKSSLAQQNLYNKYYRDYIIDFEGSDWCKFYDVEVFYTIGEQTGSVKLNLSGDGRIYISFNSSQEYVIPEITEVKGYVKEVK